MYTCWSKFGSVAPEHRAAIAGALTEMHHEVAVAPRCVVQVVFTEVTPGSLFVTGEPAPRGHVWIRAGIQAGRTDD